MASTAPLLIGGLLIGVGALTGNAALLASAAGVGVNWTSETLPLAWQRWHGRKYDTALARVYHAALQDAVAQLKKGYLQDSGPHAETHAFDVVASAAHDLASAEYPSGPLVADTAQSTVAAGLVQLLAGDNSDVSG